MDELVQYLAEGDHPVVVQRYKSADELKMAIDRGYVLVKFTDTRGGTELGLRLDRDATDLSDSNFDHPNGAVRLMGNLTLNYVRVCCEAVVDVATLKGKGHLVILSE